MLRTVTVGGAATVTLSLDPREFGGNPRAHVRDEIMRSLNGVPPDIEWYLEEIEAAVEVICGPE